MTFRLNNTYTNDQPIPAKNMFGEIIWHLRVALFKCKRILEKWGQQPADSDTLCEYAALQEGAYLELCLLLEEPC